MIPSDAEKGLLAAAPGGGLVVNSNSDNITSSNNNSIITDYQFPDHCTWKCYLRQNVRQTPVNMTQWNETMAFQHYQQQLQQQQLQEQNDSSISNSDENHGNTNNNKNNNNNKISCNCKIVILAGPHKAASTTLQDDAIRFSKIDTVPWKWPGENYAKSFAPFVHAWTEQQLGTSTNHHITKNKHIHNDLQAKIAHEYNNGYNIVLGAEAIDRITIPTLGHSLMDDFLSTFPAAIRKYNLISTMVVYRSPRIDHIKSLWMQLKTISKSKVPENATLYQFLCNNDYFMNRFEAIDSLLLAQTLLEEGFHVDLVDMMGVLKNKEMDFFSVLGCDVMGMPCQQDDETNLTVPIAIAKKKDAGEIIEKFTHVSNKRNRDKSVTNMTLQNEYDIDQIIREYDCTQQQYLIDRTNSTNSNRLNILYGDIFMEGWNECQLFKNGFRSLTRQQVMVSIQSVLNC